MGVRVRVRARARARAGVRGEALLGVEARGDHAKVDVSAVGLHRDQVHHLVG